MFTFPCIQEALSEIKGQLYICEIAPGLEKHQSGIMRPFIDN